MKPSNSNCSSIRCTMRRRVPVWFLLWGMALNKRRMRRMAPTEFISMVTVNHTVTVNLSMECWSTVIEADLNHVEFPVQLRSDVLHRWGMEITGKPVRFAMSVILWDSFWSLCWTLDIFYFDRNFSRRCYNRFIKNAFWWIRAVLRSRNLKRNIQSEYSDFVILHSNGNINEGN